jgi:pSer/pThr/pTyr-binding forkhead associated (FHA) protein
VIIPDAARRAAPLSPLSTREPPTEDPAFLSELHCLTVEGDELDEGIIIVEAAGAKIGRAAPADIVISHKSVSREHCIIGLANDELLVTDLNSTNGTYIDDVRISRTTILPVGSILRLGQISLRHTTQNPSQAERIDRQEKENGKGDPRTERVAASSR